MATFPPVTKLSAAVLGLTVGFSLASICVVFFKIEHSDFHFVSSIVNTVHSQDVHSREMQNLSKDFHEEFPKSLGQYLSGNIKFEDLRLHKDNDAISKALYQKEKVLCWIMTSPKNLDVKARVVRDTWTRRCNKVLFMSSVTDPKFPTIGLNVSEGRKHLTAKTMQAFRYIYENHFDDADWFMKADDDTYVILENLRYFLTSQNKSEPVFFGHHFKTLVKQGYYSGGAGYVLSKEALRRYGEKGHEPKLCRRDGGSEDVAFGRCMENLGVRTANTADALGRSRFHCFWPEFHLEGKYPRWFYRFDPNGAAKKGVDSISDYAISFHYVKPQKMYDLEFYIYHLRPYGIVSGTQELNRIEKVKPGTQEINT
ncbi:glycoprotein-N-acetylgalactosamine 3-beta-galactosyltransferase 1-like [Haliotis rubra]|uniref:glycoprotein-N-acetylgalactosamine 3-beta-galactosyltransferase 1-like n=1 Tax=Haliotis rubra TaxID=36100 RepID=UPI001EE5599C|nr:glycoprotein-N-acetylgalactosamine 3-beta-galactosyltransferase 1-like [Haliotis rubra]XP_046555652.1 glycoprotein-N-acetylgalactosamine 3-beta-galactosyltransferase 1-like [Haliotis rubra]